MITHAHTYKYTHTYTIPADAVFFLHGRCSSPKSTPHVTLQLSPCTQAFTWLNVCMHVRVSRRCVHICICIYSCIYVYIYIYIHIYIYIYIHIHPHTHINVHVSLCTRTHAHTHTKYDILIRIHHGIAKSLYNRHERERERERESARATYFSYAPLWEKLVFWHKHRWTH
jgi:hypothetical protein